jgi:hypothetical protein
VVSEVHSYHVQSTRVITSKILILTSCLLVNPRFRFATGDRKLLFVQVSFPVILVKSKFMVFMKACADAAMLIFPVRYKSAIFHLS